MNLAASFDKMKLQNAIEQIPGNGLFANSIKENAKTDLSGVVKMIKDQLRDGHKLILVDIVGEKVITLIEQWS